MHTLPALTLAAALLITAAPDPVRDAAVLVHQGDHDAALKLLAGTQPTKANQAEYTFYRACCHFRLNQRAEAEVWVKRVLDSFDPVPTRYLHVAHMMAEDLKHWKQNDLGDIGRDMRISGDRLQVARAGEQTQKVQKEIVDKLDRLIKEQEDKANGKGQGEKDQQAQGKQQQQGEGKGQPAPDSKVMGGSGEGKVDDRKLRQIAENWGTLPPAERQRVVQEITRDLPPKYRPMIEEYFKSLNRINPRP